MKARVVFVVAGVLAGAAAVFHLLFAVANFGLARDEEAAVSVPLLEGVLLLVAAMGLGAAAYGFFTRRPAHACLMALAGTVPLPVFYAFTVPEHSDWIFLAMSLVVPVLVAVVLVGRTTRRRAIRDPVVS